MSRVVRTPASSRITHQMSKDQTDRPEGRTHCLSRLSHCDSPFPPVESAHPMIGENVAHYRVTSKLGAGGMGEVFRATDSRLHRDVALKFLPEHLANDKERMARFH